MACCSLYLHRERSARTIYVRDQVTHDNSNNREIPIDEESIRPDQVKNPNNIWVKNLSKTPLTKAEERLLAHGPNFAVVPREPPLLDYITAIERTCYTASTREGGRA